jgi:hypothetical protein
MKTNKVTKLHPFLEIVHTLSCILEYNFDPLQMGILMLVIETSDVMLHSMEESFPTRQLPGDYELTGNLSSATLGSCREHNISSLRNIYEEVC